MSYSVKDNTQTILGNAKRRANIFLRLAAEDVERRSTKNTPKRTGDLRRSILKSVLGLHGRVEWRKVYASKMESKQFSNYTTPGTGPHFARNAVQSMVDNTRSIARRAGLIK